MNGSKWYSLEAFRATNQAIGRVIRHSRWEKKNTQREAVWGTWSGFTAVLRIRDIRYGSGSSDPYLWLTDLDADPGSPKTSGFYGSGSGSGSGSGTLVHIHHSSNIKVVKKSQNSRNQGWWWKDPDPYLWRIRMRIREAQKHKDTDPDADPCPQHCFTAWL